MTFFWEIELPALETPVLAARGVLAAVGEPAFPQAGPDLGRLGGLAELGDAGAYD